MDPVNLKSNTTNIKIERTEYSLDEIYSEISKTAGEVVNNIEINKQFSLFDNMYEDFSECIEEPDNMQMRYITTNITNVYLEEMEEYSG